MIDLLFGGPVSTSFILHFTIMLRNLVLPLWVSICVKITSLESLHGMEVITYGRSRASISRNLDMGSKNFLLFIILILLANSIKNRYQTTYRLSQQVTRCYLVDLSIGFFIQSSLDLLDNYFL